MNSMVKLVFLCVPVMFWACSGQESSVGQGRGGDDIALFSLNITDAPVDGVIEVWVRITGYTIHAVDGDTVSRDFDPVDVNLLSLQGTNSLKLVVNDVVPVGDYNWLRLHVNATIDEVFDSYVTLQGGNSYELNIPSGSQTGLKINTPFTLEADMLASRTIDFDLRKSLVLTGSGEYQLRPTLRLVDDALAGSVSGAVNATLISSPDQCSDNDPNTGNAVYVYKGFDVVPEDLNDFSINDVITANVVWSDEYDENETDDDEFKGYMFEVGFLEAGDYTIALTCQADQDDPETMDSMVFVYTKNVTVVANEPAAVSLPLR